MLAHSLRAQASLDLREGNPSVASHALGKHFDYFFGRLNPSKSFEDKAANHYGAVKALIENRTGPAAELEPTCFLQGSYRHETATYTINDVDIVALCELWHSDSGEGQGRSWSRDEIFDTIAAPLENDWRYQGKVRYNAQSMCVKVIVDPKLEILPVVYRFGNLDPQKEPFRLYRPERNRWEDGYARYHRSLLSWKNELIRTGNNFIPAIKVFKHLRTQYHLSAVSFHIECLLFSFPNALFLGGPADYIPALLGYLTASPAASWYDEVLNTPCGERDIFTSSEWQRSDWNRFHEVATVWEKAARAASQAVDREDAIRVWQSLLGSDFFPRHA
jgi:hypothetical protein